MIRELIRRFNMVVVILLFRLEDFRAIRADTWHDTS